MKNFLRFSLFAMLLMAVPVFAQKDKDKAHKKKIEKIAGDACDCTQDIASGIPKDSIVAKINSCITAHIMASQMGSVEELVKQAVEAKGDTVVGAGTTQTIYVDQDFDEIQSFLFKNCPRVKTLMDSNDVQSNKSMSKNKKALEYYHEAEGYETKGEYEKAIELYKKAVKEDKQFAFAWDNMGYCYRKMENYKEAIKCYEQSIKIDPTGLMPRQNMGVAYLLAQDYKKAGEAYEGLIKYDPKNPEGYYGAGRAFYLAESYEKATDYMFKAYKMYKQANSPYVEDAQNMLAAMYQDLKEKDKLDIITKAAKDNGINME